MARRTILVVVAHADDCELTCAGSVARWIDQGDRAFLLLATDGARGGKTPGSRESEITGRRRQEQEAAARVIGFADVLRLDFPDGAIVNDTPLRRDLVEQVRRLQPDVVACMDPTTVIFRNSYVNHSDHRALGMAVLDALYPQASNAGYFPEQIEAGLAPHKVPELLLFQSEAPNDWTDVTTTLDRRFEALRCHRSQMQLWPDGGEGVIRQQRAVAEAAGIEHGVGYAEEFRRIVVNPLS